MNALKLVFASGVYFCWLSTFACAVEPPIAAIAFAPDGRAVVIGSQAGLVVRSWPELKQQRMIATKLVNIHDLAFSPNGKSLAVAGGAPSEEGVVEVFGWPSDKLLFTRVGHKDSVLAVVWTSNTSFATASLDHEIAVWSTAAAEPVQRLKGHSRGVAALCYLAKQKMLVSAGIDQNLRVWSLETATLARTLNNHTKEIHQLALRPSAERLPMIASVSDDRTVRLWQPTIGRMVRFAQLESTPLAVCWLPDGSRVAVATANGRLQLIDPDTVEIVHDSAAIDGWAYSLAAHPTDGGLLVGGRRGQLKRVIP